MEEEKRDVLPVIWRKERNKEGPPHPDLYSQYQEIVSAIRRNPHQITAFQNVIHEAIREFAKTKGELVILDDRETAYFSHKGRSFTNFGAIPLEVEQIHSLESIRYEIELLILGKDIPTQVIKVESSKLASSQWFERLGVAHICERNKLWNLKVLIQVMAKYAPTEEHFQYSGWKLGSNNIYILADHQLCDKNLDIHNAKSLCEHVLQMLDVAPHSLTIPLLAIEILSLVHSRVMETGIYFKGVCCLVAPTQSFKTTLASLFFSYEKGTEADVNFEATTAAIVRTVGSIRDSVAVIDDYKPGATKTESNDMVQKLGKIVRMCSDDSGGIKKAGTNNATLANIAHGIVVVTAEQIQLSVQSTLARLLVLELNRKSVDREKLTWLQVNHDKYQAFIKNFILYICRQGVDYYCKRLAQKFLQERNTLRTELDEKGILVDNRSSDMCTWLYISFLEFLNYVFDVKGIDKEQLDSFSIESKKVFLELLEQQAERVSELDETKRFFKALQVLLETREVQMEKLQARNNSYATANSQSAIGFFKQGHVYLKNSTAFQQVVAYYRRNGKDFTTSETALRKRLADNGCILPNGTKSFIHRLYVNHETYQCIKFNDVIFQEMLRGGKNSGAEGDREIPDNRCLYQNAENFLGRGV